MADSPNTSTPHPRAPRLEYELPVAYRSVSGFVTDWAVNLSKGASTSTPTSRWPWTRWCGCW